VDYDTNTGPAIGLIFVAVMVVFVVIYVVALLAAYVLMALALSQFFRKVGVEPSIGWIPIYGYWKWLEVGGQQGWLSLLVLVPYANIVTAIFLAIGMHRTGIAFGKDSSWVVLGIFLPFVWCFLLARPTEVYDPRRITAAGYPPPLAGFGAVPPAPAAAPAA
jgi:Family of unknown function (DUF5684)